MYFSSDKCKNISSELHEDTTQLGAGDHLKKSIRVAILGDYDPSRVRQVATTTAMEHATRKIGVSIEITWVLQAPLRLQGREGLSGPLFSPLAKKVGGGPATSQLVTQTETLLADFDAYFGAPGAVTSVEGAIRGIQYAGKSQKPFLGTCAGFQYQYYNLLEM